MFANPETGDVYDASKLRKRFKDAIAVAAIRLPLLRRHHDRPPAMNFTPKPGEAP